MIWEGRVACGPSEIGREEESCQGRAEGMNIRPRSLRPVDQALDTGVQMLPWASNFLSPLSGTKAHGNQRSIRSL